MPSSQYIHVTPSSEASSKESRSEPGMRPFFSAPWIIRKWVSSMKVALRAAVTSDAPQTPHDLLAQVQESLKADSADIRVTLDELRAQQLLVADGVRLRPTDAGCELLAAVGAETTPISARIWGGIPAEDLAAVSAASSPWSPGAPTRSLRH